MGCHRVMGMLAMSRYPPAPASAPPGRVAPPAPSPPCSLAPAAPPPPSRRGVRREWGVGAGRWGT